MKYNFARVQLDVLLPVGDWQHCGELGQLLLRRNAEMAITRWCIDRYDGLCVRFPTELSRMNAKEFGAAVSRLVTEAKELIELSWSEGPQPVVPANGSAANADAAAIALAGRAVPAAAT